MKIELASFRLRFLAFLIDMALIFSLYVFLVGTAMWTEQWYMISVFQLLVFGVSAACSIFFTANPQWQGALGKKLMKIRVVDQNGETLGLRESSIRFCLSWASGALMGIGHLMALIDDKKRAAHDFGAHSLVVV